MGSQVFIGRREPITPPPEATYVVEGTPAETLRESNTVRVSVLHRESLMSTVPMSPTEARSLAAILTLEADRAERRRS